jgi:hypothetical protein
MGWEEIAAAKKAQRSDRIKEAVLKLGNLTRHEAGVPADHLRQATDVAALLECYTTGKLTVEQVTASYIEK